MSLGRCLSAPVAPPRLNRRCPIGTSRQLSGLLALVYYSAWTDVISLHPGLARTPEACEGMRRGPGIDAVPDATRKGESGRVLLKGGGS